MRNGVLGSIAALTAGASLALGQGPGPAGPPTGGGYNTLVPASGQFSPPIPPHLGGVDGPAIIPADMPGPNGAPIYPPPGMYGTVPYGGGADGAAASALSANHFLAPHWWFSAEYLLWWVKSQPTRAPLLTTGARAEGGVIGRPTTTVLVGDCDYGYGLFSGFRFSGGFFRDADRRYGLELSGFMLEQNSVDFFAVSDPNGVPVIARPFVDAGSGAQGVLTVSFPNLASGTALFKTTTQTWGAEGSLVVNLCRACPDDCKLWTIDGLFGFRYMQLHEIIDITSSSTLLGANQTSFAGLQVTAPATIIVHDLFETTNNFYGGQFGIRAERRYGRWHGMFTGKVAIGLNNQTLVVDGRSDVIDPTRGIAATNPGGLLANPSTICSLRHDEVAVLSEINLALGYAWTSSITTFIGYNFTHINNVIRPGDQITNVINPALIPTSPTYGLGGLVPTPNVLFTQSDFWMQGISAGVLVKY